MLQAKKEFRRHPFLALKKISRVTYNVTHIFCVRPQKLKVIISTKWLVGEFEIKIAGE